MNAFSVDGDVVPLTVTDRLTAAPPAFGVALAHVWPSEHDTARRGRRRPRRGPGGGDPERAVVHAGAPRPGRAGRDGGGGPPRRRARRGALPRGARRRPERARRGGGARADRASDRDVARRLVGRASGGGPGVRPAVRRSSSSCRPRGGSSRSTALHEAAAGDGIEWVRVYRRPGHVFGELRRGADRAGAVLATGADRDEALARARRAADAVRFRVDADAP